MKSHNPPQIFVLPASREILRTKAPSQLQRPSKQKAPDAESDLLANHKSTVVKHNESYFFVMRTIPKTRKQESFSWRNKGKYSNII